MTNHLNTRIRTQPSQRLSERRFRANGIVEHTIFHALSSYSRCSIPARRVTATMCLSVVAELIRLSSHRRCVLGCQPPAVVVVPPVAGGLPSTRQATHHRGWIDLGVRRFWPLWVPSLALWAWGHHDCALSFKWPLKGAPRVITETRNHPPDVSSVVMFFGAVFFAARKLQKQKKHGLFIRLSDN